MFENFPYTNYHNLNLDWIINKVKEAYGPDNPPPTFVMSVNGQTGDVIVYPDAVVKLPTVEQATWNIFRFANGTERGVEFSPGEMKRIDGTGRYKVYDEQNPPPYPVISVNGETGNVILYRSAYIALPTVQEDTWTFYRISSGTPTGIQFTAEKAQRISGSNRYDIYDAQNPPPYPVVSVNGKTGIVTTPFVNPSESILDLDTDSPGDTWGFARNTLKGKATLYLDTTGNDIKAYIQYVSDDETIYKEYPLLTNSDIPESAGVVSVNGEFGVVTVYGSRIKRSSTNAQSIDAALTALENNVSNNSDAITELTNITDGLAIVANGDTHPQIASGQFVIVRNHSTLPDGVYKATAAIQTDGTLSTNNLQADGAGGLNNLQSQVNSLNSNFTTLHTISGGEKTSVSGYYIQVGMFIIASFVLTVNEAVSENEVVVTGTPKGAMQQPIVGFRNTSGVRENTVLLRTDTSYNRMYANGAMSVGTFNFSGVYLVGS